ncbi:rho gtpase activating protein at 16f isoform e-related [Anaeramoeba flamelloides]|uniref:Rho gtpase activating protein at 16f isoform e-related n=1 Tax=Anaeramoeba flamelloides TaxID=1746091 RepID=A0AAV7YHZ2_9EUKA|nr:rho gtpase activating protein at 16f isoform e-related [Anaeramoeba flamelloides]
MQFFRKKVNKKDRFVLPKQATPKKQFTKLRSKVNKETENKTPRRSHVRRKARSSTLKTKKEDHSLHLVKNNPRTNQKQKQKKKQRQKQRQKRPRQYSKTLRGLDLDNATITKIKSSHNSPSLMDYKKKKNKNKNKRKELQKKKLFGLPLKEAIKNEGKLPTSPPQIIEKTIMYIEEYGMQEEGIYRLSGSISQMKNLKKQFNKGVAINLYNAVDDVKTVSSLLKLYLRELPEPLLTEKYTERLGNLALLDKQTQIKRLTHVCNRIPEANKTILVWILPHLYRVAKNSEINKMCANNLAIVFSPTLQIPLKIMIVMINNWVDILINKKNKKSRKTRRQKRGINPKWIENDSLKNN